MFLTALRPRRTWLLALALVGTTFVPGAAGLDAPDPGEALRDAAAAGDRARVTALLAAGTPVDAGARHGQTALYFAAEKGRLEVVRLLVERGAKVGVRDRFFGSSPLDMALRGGHVEVARYLLARGAPGADAALQAAVQRGDAALVRAALRGTSSPSSCSPHARPRKKRWGRARRRSRARPRCSPS